MSKKKKSVPKASGFVREFSALARQFQALSPGNRKAAALRKKIYNLMAGAVLNAKTKKLKTEELDQILEFVRSDTCVADNDQFDRAVAVLEKLSNENNIQASVILADLYAAQFVKPPLAYRKHSRAMILYEKITKGKNRFFAGYAHYRLAGMRLNFAGDGDAGHKALALTHAEKSAYDFESPYGLVMLGCWYCDAQVVEKDWKKSHDHFKRAYAVVKDPHWHDPWIKWTSYFHYGYAVMHGEGCGANEKRGYKLLKEAAEHDNIRARDCLAKYEGTTDASADAANNPMASFAKKRKKKRAKVKTKKELDEMLKPLHAMIGCAPVKREIESLIYLAHANALRLQKKIDVAPPNLHAAFLGSPGTGKTTVARMYGQILHELGFLTSGHLVEATRADMIAEWIGQTAPKVRAMVEKAIGGVLFIDEAYSLVPDDDFRDFGPEAIAELIQQMENRRDNLVVVFAGYTNQMKVFLKTNPGLKSRVPGIVEFPDYSVDEMVRIFEKFCEDAHFIVKPDALPLLAAYLKKLDKESVRRMGNARGIRNIFDDTIMRQSRRIVREGKTAKKALMTIEAQDLHLPDDPGKGILTVIRGGKTTDL